MKFEMQLMQILLHIESLAEELVLLERANLEMNSGDAEPMHFRDSWLDKQEVLQLLHISERTLFNLRKQGRLNARLLGGKMYFYLPEIEEVLNSQKKSDP